MSYFYKLPKRDYESLMHNAITTTLSMFINGKNNSFITLKEKKPCFQNNPKVHLLNSAKNELGRISKHILDKINNKLRDTTKSMERHQ